MSHNLSFIRGNKDKHNITFVKMSDRRRSDNYKQVSGYVLVELAQEFKSICAREGVSQSDALEEMLSEWVAKRKDTNSSKAEQFPLTTIADLVRVNLTKLKRSGRVKNLQALATGEVLPTLGDFAIITSTLGIPEEERKTIWRQTLKRSLYSDSGGVKEDEYECS